MPLKVQDEVTDVFMSLYMAVYKICTKLEKVVSNYSTLYFILY